MMDTKYLEEIKARCEKATTGEWIAFEDEIVNSHENARGARYTPIVSRVKGRECWLKHEDAEFIAHSRTDIPALLAEVERLQEECSTLEKALEPTCRSIATAYGKYYDPYATTEEREKLLPQLMHYFIQQAQEHEENNGNN